MSWTYKYYIWDDEVGKERTEDDNLQERIEKALGDAGLQFEYDTIED